MQRFGNKEQIPAGILPPVSQLFGEKRRPMPQPRPRSPRTLFGVIGNKSPCHTTKRFLKITFTWRGAELAPERRARVENSAGGDRGASDTTDDRTDRLLSRLPRAPSCQLPAFTKESRQNPSDSTAVAEDGRGRDSLITNCRSRRRLRASSSGGSSR